MAIRRRDVLGAAASLGVVGLPAVAAGSAKRLVVVLAQGGWDPTLTFNPPLASGAITGAGPDLNPDDPNDVEKLATYDEIQLTTNAARRPHVTAYFDEYASSTSVINGLWVGTASHQGGVTRILTGTTDLKNPNVVSLVGQTHGTGRPLAMMDLSSWGQFGDNSSFNARTGVSAQLKALLKPSVRLPVPPEVDYQRPGWEPDATTRLAMDRWLEERQNDAAHAPYEGWSDAIVDRQEAIDRAKRLSALPSDAIDALPGAAGSFLGRATAAAELLSHDVCHSILLDTAFRWDTHANHTRQHAIFDQTFEGLAAMRALLDARGLGDDVVIVVVSELGRTPFRNDDNGTEHWPYTSALIAGPGVAGGKVCGATDDNLVGQPVRLDTGRPDDSGVLLRYDSFVAGILRATGVDEPLQTASPFLGFLA